MLQLLCVLTQTRSTSGSHQSWRRWRWIWWGSLGMHQPRRTLQVTRHTSHVARHTSHVTRQTSHVTRHTSHVTRHISHFTRHTCYCISECSFIALRYVHDTTEAKHLHPTSFKAQNPYQNMRMQAHHHWICLRLAAHNRATLLRWILGVTAVAVAVRILLFGVD